MAASQSSRRTTGPLRRTTSRRQDSWEQVDSQGTSFSGLRSPTSLGNSSFGIASILQLPKEMSGSSSLQVERGAELLDQLSSEVGEHLQDPDADEDSLLAVRYEAGMSLLDGLKDVSAGIVARMDERRSKDGTAKLSKPWKNRIQSLKDPLVPSLRRFDSSVLDTADEPENTEYRKAQAERNTWDLLRRVLPIRKPQPQYDGMDMNDSIRNFLDTRGVAHVYTAGPELWERFLLEDASAREKKVVLDWLEHCSAACDDWETLIQQLGETLDKPDMTWNDGYQSTRAKIKLEKIKRRTTTCLDSATLRTSDNTEPLVSQLDPDAVTRQGKSLEKEDEQLDRSLWLACFAMLRRGMPWKTITSFFEERGEGWRAASFGMAVSEQQSKTSLGGMQAGMLWRQMCLAAARHGGLDVYERAVYGLLAGDIESVDPACRSFDDLLYARYNALLLRSFEKSLQDAFPDKYNPIISQKFQTLTSTLSEEELSMDPADYVYKVTNHLGSSDEASDPMKTLQASIIADDFETLITHLGIIIASRANQDTVSRLLPPLHDYVHDSRYECLAEDFDVIRMVVHVFAIYEYAGYEFPEPFRRDTVEYVIVAYIDYLRLQRKIEAIPTYAALLSADRRHRTLGVILVDISEPAEQQELIHLISEQNVDLALVITEQYRHAASLMGFLDESRRSITDFQLVERTKDARWPGFRIRRDFKPQALSYEESRLVRSVTWYIYVDSPWRNTFYGLSYAMRVFLLSGMFNGGLQVTKDVPYKVISLKKTADVLGRAVDVFEQDAMARQQSPPAQQLRRSTRANSRQLDDIPVSTEPLSEEDGFKLSMLRSQCRQYREMQQICLALEQLSYWKDFEEVVMQKEVTLEIKKELASLLEEVTESIQPLLHGFMTLIDSEVDEEDYTTMRLLYVPAILMGYASARSFAAIHLGPETLIPVLELAACVANDENKELANDFVKSGRMKEFVQIMAMTSKIMIRLNQERAISGKKKASNRSRFWEGETVEIWDPTTLL